MARHSALVAAREWVRQNLGRYRSFDVQLRSAFEAGVAWCADELGSHYLQKDKDETQRQAREWAAAVSGAAHTTDALATSFVIGVNYWRDHVTPKSPSSNKHPQISTPGETRARLRPSTGKPSTSQVRRQAAREESRRHPNVPSVMAGLRTRESIEPCAPFMHRVKHLLYTPSLRSQVSQRDLVRAFARYRNCDWGDVPRREVKRNNRATRQPGFDSILGSYTSADGVVFWIETEPDFSSTTFFLPEER